MESNENTSELFFEDKKRERKKISDMSLQAPVPMAEAENEGMTDDAVFVFDEKDAELGYNAPFKLILKSTLNREKLIDSVRGIIYKFKDNPKMRGSFTNWFCGLFRFPSDIFDSSEKLEQGVGKIADTFTSLSSVKEEVREAQPYPSISFTSIGDKKEDK